MTEKIIYYSFRPPYFMQASNFQDTRMNPPPYSLPFLCHYIRLFKWRFSLLFLLLLVWATNEALFPYFLKLMIEETQIADLEGSSLWERFRFPVLGISGCWLAMEVSMRLFGIIEIYLFPQIRTRMREDIFALITDRSVSYFTSHLSGSIGGKISDIPKSSQHILEHFIWHIMGTVLVFSFSLIVVAQASLVFTFLMMGWCALHMGITLYYLKEINHKTSEHYESLARLNGETVDTVGNAATMKLFSRELQERQRIRTFQQVEMRKYIKAGWALQKVNFLRGFTGLCFIAATLYLLLEGWQEGWLGVGDLPLVAMSSFNLMGLIWQMSMALLDMLRDVGSLDGALSLVREKQELMDNPAAIPLRVKEGGIEFRNVVFGYDRAAPLFSGLSVFISPGEKVGLVGFSGSGKTTFVNLILRTHDLMEGQILIDSQDISRVTQSSLRENISFIPQDPSLFHRSVRENISYGKPDVSREEMEKSARLAHCHDFIMAMKEGYETVLGERGAKISGGQRQRLAIARAFLKDAPLLILDEATSALDSATEKHIQESLLKLMAGRTALIVAHRLSTLKYLDRILVFDKGAIVEQGSYDELIQKRKHFYYLWSLQHAGFLPEKGNSDIS